MRAYLIQGSNKQPILRELPSPTPGPGELLVRTKAVGLHPVDMDTIDGKNAMMLPFQKPFIPGVDYAGEILEPGPGVTDLTPGMQVYGYQGLGAMGAFAEEIVVPRTAVAVAPASMQPTEQAALPLPSLCALQALDGLASKQPMQILVHGGAGGVGSIAVQIFAAKGHDVTATASPKDATWVTALGATTVIDYQKERFEDNINNVDLVFDTVGGDTLKRSFQVLKPGGVVASLNAMPEASVLLDAGMKVPGFMRLLLPMMGWPLRRKAKAAKGRLSAQVTVPSAARLAQATEIGDTRGLQTRIDRVFSFKQMPEAIEYCKSKRARGRIIVKTYEP